MLNASNPTENLGKTDEKSPNKRMKLFRSTYDILAGVGIYPLKSIDNLDVVKRWNGKMVSRFLFYLLACVTTVVFITSEATNLSEYAESVYAVVTSYTVISLFILLLVKTNTIFNLISRFEDIVEKRE